MAELKTFEIKQHTRRCHCDGHEARWHMFGFENNGHTSRAVAIVEYDDGMTGLVDADSVIFLEESDSQGKTTRLNSGTV